MGYESEREGVIPTGFESERVLLIAQAVLMALDNTDLVVQTLDESERDLVL